VGESWTDELWQKTLAEIRRRATSDAAFRARCLADAHKVIKEVCGQEPPAQGPRVRFAETLNEQVILLPPSGASGRELTEAELAQAAGGVDVGLLTNPGAAYGSICWSPQLPGVTQSFPFRK
jgi:hypothetical protein